MVNKETFDEQFKAVRSNDESNRNQRIYQVLNKKELSSRDIYTILVSTKKYIYIPKAKHTIEVFVDSPLHLVTYSGSGKNIKTNTNLDLMCDILKRLDPKDRLKALQEKKLPQGVSILDLIKLKKLEVKRIIPSIIPLLTPEESISYFVVDNTDHEQAIRWLREIFRHHDPKACFNALFKRYHLHNPNYATLLSKIKDDETLRQLAQKHLGVGLFGTLMNEPIHYDVQNIVPHFFKIVVRHCIDNKIPITHQSYPHSPFHTLAKYDQNDDAIELIRDVGALDLAFNYSEVTLNYSGVIETPFLILLEKTAEKYWNTSLIDTLLTKVNFSHMECLNKLIPNDGRITFFTRDDKQKHQQKHRCLIMNSLDLEINHFEKLSPRQQCALLKSILPLVNYVPPEGKELAPPNEKIWSLIAAMQPTDIEKLIKQKEVSKKDIETILLWRANANDFSVGTASVREHFNKILTQDINTSIPILTKASPKLFPTAKTLKNYIEQNMIKSQKNANLMKAIAIYRAIDTTEHKGNDPIDMTQFRNALAINTGTGYGTVTSAGMFKKIDDTPNNEDDQRKVSPVVNPMHKT